MFMGKHFSEPEFVRHVGKDVMRQACAHLGILSSHEWGKKQRLDAEEFHNALAGELLEARQRALTLFEQAWNLAGPGFTGGLTNEAEHRGDLEALETIRRLRGTYKVALWALISRPQYVEKAARIGFVDKLADGAWVKRRRLPRRPGPVDGSMIGDLEAALIDFFLRREGRGETVHVDALRRRSEEIFFVYAANRPDSELLFRGPILTSHTITRPFRLIYRHDDARQTLDVYYEGPRTNIPELQRIFVQNVLREEFPDDQQDEDVLYDLQRVMEKDFQFIFPAGSPIRSAHVQRARFVVQGEPWRRFTAEARGAGALSQFAEALMGRLPHDRVAVDQIEITVKPSKDANLPDTRRRVCVITAPNVLRLKKDRLGDAIVELLEHSGLVLHTPPDDD